MASGRRPRRFGAEYQIRQAHRNKEYERNLARALNNGALGKASNSNSETQVKNTLTRGS